ncbi:serine protease [Vibrio sagamiensis]|uniref:Peptidase n=1 Tax=Vibrio sagamiensis NBRC 104589 TaxID=1219064 RepID=A0A511QB82_9VIBR|nr:serine protease [Vibrio sagamiensis]PNQ57665.1 peptidase [Vibrio agarivorans]GEM74545.1 peptidase [Vibrio sagamiensis NBRC 104589]
MAILKNCASIFIAGSFVSPFAFSTETLISIADKVEHNYLFETQGQSDTTVKHTISHPGATFIKVHFDKFKLGPGDVVTMKGNNSQDTIRYQQTSHTPFFARSIDGDSLTIEWTKGQADSRALSIDYYTAGFSDEKIKDLEAVGGLSTCGVNERVDAVCWQESHPDNFGWSHSVARLLIDGRSLCTAWRVGPNNHMMTNNHCVSTASKLKNTEVWFNYQRTTCDGELGDTIKIMADQIIKTNYELDYTLFSIKDFEQIADFGYLGLDDSPPIYGSEIYIPQHGAGKPKEMAIESDKNSTGLCQIDQADADGRGTDTDTGYFCDTIGGSSGSPVLLADSHKVIALHHFGGCENQGVQINKIWPEIAEFFDHTLPAGQMGKQSPVSEYPIVQVGEKVENITLEKNQQRIFKLLASSRSQASVVKISADSGDGDLYTKSGSVPSKASYHCRPYRSDSNEQCKIAIGDQDLYIMIRGYSSVSDLTLSIEPDE